MARTIVPNLGDQLEDLITFVDRLSRYYHDDLDRNPYGPPICEIVKAPVKPYEVVAPPPANVIPSKLHFDFRGKPIGNARECPHCGTIHYTNASVGQVLACGSCGHGYIWSDI